MATFIAAIMSLSSIIRILESCPNSVRSILFPIAFPREPYPGGVFFTGMKTPPQSDFFAAEKSMRMSGEADIPWLFGLVT